MCEKSASLETLDNNIHCNILRFVARFDDRCFLTLKALTSTCKVYYSLLKNPYILRCICEEVCPSATGADSLELIAFMAHANCFLRPQSNSKLQRKAFYPLVTARIPFVASGITLTIRLLFLIEKVSSSNMLPQK